MLKCLITLAFAACARNVHGCATTGGTADGAPCAFPFRYKGEEYTSCTSINNNGMPWCKTHGSPMDELFGTAPWGNCPATGCPAATDSSGKTHEAVCGCEEDGVKFCNFDDGDYGTCEPCDKFIGIGVASCTLDDLPARGAADCKKRCFDSSDRGDFVFGTGVGTEQIEASPCTSHSQCAAGNYCDNTKHCWECASIGPDWCDQVECEDGRTCDTCCSSPEFLAHCPPQEWKNVTARCEGGEDCHSWKCKFAMPGANYGATAVMRRNPDDDEIECVKAKGSSSTCMWFNGLDSCEAATPRWQTNAGNDLTISCKDKAALSATDVRNRSTHWCFELREDLACYGAEVADDNGCLVSEGEEYCETTSECVGPDDTCPGEAALASGDVCYSSGGVGVDRKYDCPTGTKCGANNDDGYNSDLTCDVPSTNFCKDPNAFLKGNWCVCNDGFQMPKQGTRYVGGWKNQYHKNIIGSVQCVSDHPGQVPTDPHRVPTPSPTTADECETDAECTIAGQQCYEHAKQVFLSAGDACNFYDDAACTCKTNPNLGGSSAVCKPLTSGTTGFWWTVSSDADVVTLRSSMGTTADSHAQCRKLCELQNLPGVCGFKNKYAGGSCFFSKHGNVTSYQERFHYSDVGHLASKCFRKKRPSPDDDTPCADSDAGLSTVVPGATCAAAKRLGYCGTEKQMAKRYCPQSCGMCSACTDLSDDCQKYQDQCPDHLIVQQSCCKTCSARAKQGDRCAEMELTTVATCMQAIRKSNNLQSTCCHSDDIMTFMTACATSTASGTWEALTRVCGMH